jgi:hypothetical protein
MFGLHLTQNDDKPFDEDILDQIEGEALIVVENPDRYAPLTVDMAHKTIDMINRLRRSRGEPELQSA